MNEKIILRPLAPSDVTPSYVSWLNDNDVRRYLGIRHRVQPFTEKDITSFLQNCIEIKRFHWGIFVNGVHIGNVSCSDWNDDNRWIDISYIIGEKKFWGRGIATPAVGAAINYLFTFHHYNKITAHAVVENIASIRLMQKLGMHQDAILRENAFFPLDNRFMDEVICSILKREWNSDIADIKDIAVNPMFWESTPTKLR